MILWLFFLVFILMFSLMTPSTLSEGFDNTRQPIDTKIDAIYYINLEKRKDRNDQYLDNFNEKDKNRIQRIAGHYYPDNGAVGCLMSHITALNKAYNEKRGENILICEDDFYIKDMEYCNRMLTFFFKNVKEWDVLMLGHNTSKSTDTEFTKDAKEKIIKIEESQTASAYLIKRTYIPDLLKIYERDMDQYLKTGKWGNYYTDQSWKVLQKKDKWYAFSPPIGVQRESYSDIEKVIVNYGV